MQRCNRLHNHVHAHPHSHLPPSIGSPSHSLSRPGFVKAHPPTWLPGMRTYEFDPLKTNGCVARGTSRLAHYHGPPSATTTPTTRFYFTYTRLRGKAVAMAAETCDPNACMQELLIKYGRSVVNKEMKRRKKLDWKVRAWLSSHVVPRNTTRHVLRTTRSSELTSWPTKRSKRSLRSG